MEEKIIYTITIRTSKDGVRAAAVVKNIQNDNGELNSRLTTAFAQEDVDVLMNILDGKCSLIAGSEVIHE